MAFTQFCDANHIMGPARHGQVFFGLMYDGEVIAGLSLGGHHRNVPVLVLDRLCFKSGVRVVGGSARLFARAVEWARNQGHSHIISWSDNRWSSGDVYRHLGFHLDVELPPDYSYADSERPYVRLSKQSQKKGNTGCPVDKTEAECALENGLARIWDCGKKRWKFDI